MQFTGHMLFEHFVHISRAADVGSECQGVERANEVVRSLATKFFCFVGHLCGFLGAVGDGVMQSQERNAEGVTRLLGGAEKKAADGGLATTTTRSDLRLRELAGTADFGDYLFPIHALIITVNCYLSMLFCYRFSVA